MKFVDAKVFFLLTLKSSLVRINFSYSQSFLKVHLPIHLIHTIIERKLLSQGKNPAEEFLLIQVKVCEVCEKDKVLRDIKKSQLSDPERELNGCLLSFFLLLVHNLAKVFLESYLNCHKEFILGHQPFLCFWCPPPLLVFCMKLDKISSFCKACICNKRKCLRNCILS